MLAHMRGGPGVLPQEAVCRQRSLELLGNPLLCEMTGRLHKYACRNTGLGKDSFPCSTICTCSPPCVRVWGGRDDRVTAAAAGCGDSRHANAHWSHVWSTSLHSVQNTVCFADCWPRIVVACSPGINVFQQREGSAAIFCLKTLS